jgi:hypothetical protein
MGIRRFIRKIITPNRAARLISKIASMSCPDYFFRFTATIKSQASPLRSFYLEKTLKEFKTPIKALEIGTWFGEGSTEVLRKNLLPGSALYLLDAWRPYFRGDDLKFPRYANMNDLSFAALHNVIKKQFAIEQSGISIETNIIRAQSKEFLGLLIENSFDLIYIDGDHTYQAVKTDISFAKKLIKKDFGIICGDDLDVGPTPKIIEKAYKSNLAVDATEDFHAGVLLAVCEEFQEVNMSSGFWWIYCVNGEFRTCT